MKVKDLYFPDQIISNLDHQSYPAEYQYEFDWDKADDYLEEYAAIAEHQLLRIRENLNANYSNT